MATVAAGHALPVVAYHLLKDGTVYRDLGTAPPSRAVWSTAYKTSATRSPWSPRPDGS